jgi:hypothetical protein
MESPTGAELLTHAYYLRSRDQADGIALLERSGQGGYVWPAANGWVPLAVRGWARSRPLLAALGDDGVLLRYAVVPGRGWSFELLSRDKCFLRYGRSADPAQPPTGELLEENLPLLALLVAERGGPSALRPAEAQAALKSILLPEAGAGSAAAALSRFAATAPHRVFAAILGLSPSAGLFCDELPSDILERGLGVVRLPARSVRRGKTRP